MFFALAIMVKLRARLATPGEIALFVETKIAAIRLTGLCWFTLSN
jgi:hypothetical protein